MENIKMSKSLLRDVCSVFPWTKASWDSWEVQGWGFNITLLQTRSFTAAAVKIACMAIILVFCHLSYQFASQFTTHNIPSWRQENHNVPRPILLLFRLSSISIQGTKLAMAISQNNCTGKYNSDKSGCCKLHYHLIECFPCNEIAHNVTHYGVLYPL